MGHRLRASRIRWGNVARALAGVALAGLMVAAVGSPPATVDVPAGVIVPVAPATAPTAAPPGEPPPSTPGRVDTPSLPPTRRVSRNPRPGRETRQSARSEVPRRGEPSRSESRRSEPRRASPSRRPAAPPRAVAPLRRAVTPPRAATPPPAPPPRPEFDPGL